MEKLSVCRICLNTNVQHVVEDPQLRELYERLTTLPFQTSDLKPLLLCYICHGQLKSSRRLMLKCLKAEQLLTEMVNQLQTNDDEELNRIMMDQSALNQLSICTVDPTIIDSTVQNVDRGDITTQFEISVKLEEHSVHDLLETVCSLELEPDNEQIPPDLEDNIPRSPYHNIDKNIDTAGEQEAVSARDDELNELKQAAPVAAKPYLEFEVRNSTNIINYVNKDTGNVTAEASEPTSDRNIKTVASNDRIQIKTERSVTKSVASDVKCQQVIQSNLKHGQNASVDDRNTKVCLHSESDKTICDICKTVFGTRYALMLHHRKHPGVRPYVCGSCKKCYKQKGHLVRLHSGVKRYPCNVCNKTFSHSSLLKSHEFMHTGVKRYPCNVCKKKFTYKSLLKSHACTKQKPYVCNVCNMSFDQVGDLNKHSFIHTGGNRYVCNVCNKSFYQMCHLRVHARIHTGEKPYECNTCNKRFSQKSYLKIHSRIHTGEKTYTRKPIIHLSDSQTNEIIYICDVCGKRFNHKGVFTRHVRLVHIGERPYGCDVCKKRFRLKCELSYHTRFHTGEKPYNCNVCNKSFHQKSTLTRHAIIHTGEKPYVCDVCNRGFNQKAILDGHQRTHTGEKPYHCDLCEKRFKSKSDLTKHRLLHTDDRRHGCDVCGRRFHRKTTLKRHARVHSNEQPHACDVCHERFRHSSTLKTHMQVHNSIFGI